MIITQKYIKCYKNLIGYYLDKKDYKYKNCYYTCKECELPGNNITHNCLICNENYISILNYSNYYNCYPQKMEVSESINIPFTTNISKENKIITTENKFNTNVLIDKDKSITDINPLTFINSTDGIITTKSSPTDDNEATTYIYHQCEYYHYFDNGNNYKCTLNLSCPGEYPKLLIDKKECIKNKELKELIIYIINTEKNETKTKEEEMEYYDIILKKIEEGFTSENYDTIVLDNGEYEIIDIEKIKITLTSIKNQKNNINMTSVDLRECEILLRNFYNLTNNETLYLKKLDIIQEGMRIPKIQYDIYSKLNSSKLTKLNLTICQNSKISLIIPIKVTDNIDILNISSGYYNDICYTTTFESGIDISLKDRKNEYIKKSVCQDDCDFSDYNYTTSIANCSCNIKQTPISFEYFNINTTKMIENIKNIKNVANLNFLICNNSLFCKEGLLKNIASYLIGTIIIFHVINTIIFYIKKLELLKNKISDIIFTIKNLRILKKKKKKTKKKKDNIENKNKLDDINNIDNEINEGESNNKKGNKLFKRKVKHIEINNNDNNENNINSNLNDKNILNINKKKKRNKKHFNSTNSKLKEPKINERIKTILEYNDNEINELEYSLALQYDSRTYCQYYISLLRTKHEIIFSFFYNKDYNSKIIKIDLFFMGFTIFYTVNALFYNDATMHNIYVSNGLYKIEYQLPKIIYSSLISMVLSTLLNKLALSNDSILDFKQNKKKKDVSERGNKLNTNLNIKFVLYFITSFIILLFFWYYLSMFGAIYKNTQFHLLKDTLISFALSQLYPFGIYLIPGIFRIASLIHSNKKRECLYIFSKILQKL